MRLSPSAIRQAERCGVQYEMQRIDKIQPPIGPSPALVRGRSLATATELDLRAVIDAMAAGASRADADLPLEAVQDAASEAFDCAARGEDRYVHDDGTVIETQGPEPAWALHEEDPGATKDLLVAGLIPAWYAGIAPTVLPAGVEVSIQAPLETSTGREITLHGRLDVLPVDGVLADLKHTSKSSYLTAQDAAEDRQLTAYDILYRAATGGPPVALGFDTLKVRRPRSVVTVTVEQPRSGPRTDQEIARYVARVERVAHGIEAGVFVPADKTTDWWCAPRWCAYWSICPYGGAG